MLFFHHHKLAKQDKKKTTKRTKYNNKYKTYNSIISRCNPTSHVQCHMPSPCALMPTLNHLYASWLDQLFLLLVPFGRNEVYSSLHEPNCYCLLEGVLRLYTIQYSTNRHYIYINCNNLICMK